MDYKNGKIYRLVCEETGKQYIGSTCTSLVKRLYNHKKKSNVCSSKILINPKIILIEDYPCDRKEQLIARERHFIETMDCVNIIKRPLLTYDEKKDYSKQNCKKWYESNKEHVLQYRQEYREQNREILCKKDKEKYKNNKQRYLNHARERYEQNREEINKKRRQKVTCECGKIVSNAGMSRHKQSKKHINLLN